MSITHVSDETDQTKLLTVKPAAEWAFVPGQVAVVGVEGLSSPYLAMPPRPRTRPSCSSW